MRSRLKTMAVVLSVVLLAGCSSVSAAHPSAPHHTASHTNASATTDAEAADEQESQLPEGFPTPPKSSDYDLSDAGDRARFAAALKAWKAKLTPAQNAQLKDSLGMDEVDPKQKAELDWFTSLAPGIQKACVQLPVVALTLAALAIPGTSETPPDSVTTYAKTIADIRDLQIDPDLRTILGSMSTQLRRHAHDTPPINDPVLEADVAHMSSWIDAHCTMPE